MKPAAKKQLIGIALAVVVLGTGLSLAGYGAYRATRFCLGFLGPGGPPPSDESFRTLFREHEAAFVSLRDMMLSEKELLAIGDDRVGDYWLFDRKWSKGSGNAPGYSESEMLEKTGLSSERYHTYLELLGSVGAFRVTKGSSSGPVSIHVARDGVVPWGYIKSIVYTLAPSGPVVDDTYAYACEDASGEGICYATIEGGWYIEYDWR